MKRIFAIYYQLKLYLLFVILFDFMYSNVVINLKTGHNIKKNLKPPKNAHNRYWFAMMIETFEIEHQ